ncbi:actin family [Piptocephalis cylindrospora]|uniref:Actin family n=1 Tax=Piptocephalis cylindrospora TaxID=1907219 RepID=A0A4P9Y0M7_9FUNG|nr:actin family [Piptocephalis cylindrospora]|eukprot:RKP12315.1 actin family [Piptocephalis cylindrospora]
MFTPPISRSSTSSRSSATAGYGVSSYGPSSPAPSSPSLASSLLSSSLGTSPLTNTLSSSVRRHSIYGTEDRIVLDLGSFYLKCGFSGEPRPRHILQVSGQVQDHQRTGACDEACRKEGLFSPLHDIAIEEEDLPRLEAALKHHLFRMYYQLLLTDPRQRKVIVCERPLWPMPLKKLLMRLLFDHFQVPSISFAPSHLLSLMTTGSTKGLVIDCGHLETTILPVFDARPLFPYVASTVRAGKFLSKRLRRLLLTYASVSTHGRPIVESMLTDEAVEEIKTRLLFASPFRPMRGASDNSGAGEDEDEDGMGDSGENWMRDTSAATDVEIRLRTSSGESLDLLIPGWVRERAAECLFDGDEDAPSITQIVLDTLLRLPIDLRMPMAENLLLAGGTAQLPNFQSRLHQDLIRTLQEDREVQGKYASLSALVDTLLFVDGRDEQIRVFQPSCRAWVGGSLVGAVKTNGPEVTRAQYDGTVPDWLASPPTPPSDGPGREEGAGER